MRFFQDGRPTQSDLDEARLAIDKALRDTGKDGRVDVDAWWLRGVLDVLEDFDEEKVRQEGFEAGLTEGKEEAAGLVGKVKGLLSAVEKPPAEVAYFSRKDAQDERDE